MAEFGVIAAKGAQYVDRLREQLHSLPEAARMPVCVLFDQLAETDKRIEQLTGEIEETQASEARQASAWPHSGCRHAFGHGHRGDDA